MTNCGSRESKSGWCKSLRISCMDTTSCSVLVVSGWTSEIDFRKIFLVVVVTNEDRRHSHQRFDRLYGPFVVVRARSHSAHLLRAHRPCHVPRYRQRSQSAGDRVHRRVGAQLGHQVGLSDSCFRGPFDASRLYDGMSDLISHVACLNCYLRS